VKHRIRGLFYVVLGGVLLTLAACRNQPTPLPPPPTQTSLPPDFDKTVQARLNRIPTMPPTWTALPTWTAVPTRTPAPTLTPLPTDTASQVCEQFKVAGAPTEGAQFSADAEVQFGWSNVPTGSNGSLFLRLLNSTDTGLRYTVPTDGDVLLSFSLSRLTGFGTYGWRISLIHPAFGEICAKEGTFVRLPTTPMPLATFTPGPSTPSITPIPPTSTTAPLATFTASPTPEVF